MSISDSKNITVTSPPAPSSGDNLGFKKKSTENQTQRKLNAENPHSFISV